MLAPAASVQPLSKLFNGGSAASAVASMAPTDTSFQDTGAPAAEPRLVHVDPMTAENQSTKGKMTTWHNPLAGQGTFMKFDDNSGPAQMPQPMTAG
jgi:hypothetical protein